MTAYRLIAALAFAVAVLGIIVLRLLLRIDELVTHLERLARMDEPHEYEVTHDALPPR